MFGNTLDYIFGREKREPRKWAIPEKHIEKFYELWDKANDETIKLNTYKLWRFIFEVLPKLHQETELEINIDCVLQPIIQEKID